MASNESTPHPAESGTELPSSPEPSAAIPAPTAELQPFTLTRLFNAPREQLFAAWTTEEALKQWFAPKGFTIPIHRLNLRPGGQFHYCMRAPNGVEMWGKWTFKEVIPPERLVLVNTFSNKHGNPTRHPYVHDWPLELLSTMTLTGHHGQTLMELHNIPIDPTPTERKTFESMQEGMTQGWTGTLDQLDEYLAKTNPTT